MSANAQYRKDFLAPRTLEGDFARLTIQKVFSAYARDSMDVGVNRNRHEYYVPADSTIESRSENVLSFTDKLDYDLDPALSTSFYVSLNGRGLDKEVRNWDAVAPQSAQFNTRIDEFHLDTYAQTTYRTPDGQTAAWLRLYYSERSETHAAEYSAVRTPSADSLFPQANAQEHINDNTARRTQLSGAVDVPVSGSDRISFSGSSWR